MAKINLGHVRGKDAVFDSPVLVGYKYEKPTATASGGKTFIFMGDLSDKYKLQTIGSSQPATGGYLIEYGDYFKNATAYFTDYGSDNSFALTSMDGLSTVWQWTEPEEIPRLIGMQQQSAQNVLFFEGDITKTHTLTYYDKTGKTVTANGFYMTAGDMTGSTMYQVIADYSTIFRLTKAGDTTAIWEWKFSTAWADVVGKPFKTVSSSFSTTNNVLDIVQGTGVTYAGEIPKNVPVQPLIGWGAVVGYDDAYSKANPLFNKVEDKTGENLIALRDCTLLITGTLVLQTATETNYGYADLYVSGKPTRLGGIGGTHNWRNDVGFSATVTVKKNDNLVLNFNSSVTKSEPAYGIRDIHFKELIN